MTISYVNDRMFGSESELKSVIVGSTSRVIFILLLLLLLEHAATYIWIHVYTPRKVARYMRSQGYSGPSMDWYGNSSVKDVRELQEKARSERQAGDLPDSSISHDVEPQVLPVHFALKERYGEKFIFYRSGRTCVSRSDPASMREIFSTKSKEYTISQGTRVFREIFGNKGLFVLVDEAWSRQRRLLRPAFYAGRSKDMVPQMATWTESWLQSLEMRVVEAGAEKNGIADIDIGVPVGNLTGDILARTSFESNFEKGKEGFDSLHGLLRLILKRATSSYSFIRWLPNPLEMEIRRLKSQYSKCLRDIVEERRQTLKSTKNGESYGGSLLDLLLADQAKRNGHGGNGDGGGGTFLGRRLRQVSRAKDDDDCMMDQFRTIFLAGADTAQSTILWSIVMLAEHGEWQTRLRSEGKEALENKASLDGETLAKLPQLDMFVNEVLRLYGPAVQLIREVAQDITSPSRGERLPKSLVVQANLLALHRRKEVWGDDALEFNPLRFSEGISKACKNTPFAYMPFGAGPRICVAQSFALIEVKLVLFMFLQRFSFRLSPAYRHEPVFELVLRPKFGVPLIMEPVLC